MQPLPQIKVFLGKKHHWSWNWTVIKVYNFFYKQTLWEEKESGECNLSFSWFGSILDCQTPGESSRVWQENPLACERARVDRLENKFVTRESNWGRKSFFPCTAAARAISFVRLHFGPISKVPIQYSPLGCGRLPILWTSSRVCVCRIKSQFCEKQHPVSIGANVVKE